MKPSPGLSSGVSRDTISLDCCGDWTTLRSRQPRKYVTEYMKRPTKLGVKSRAFDAARHQMTIRSLRRRPSELHSSWRPEGQQGWLFCRWSLLRSRDLLATPFRSGLPPLFWSNTPSADFCDMMQAESLHPQSRFVT